MQLILASTSPRRRELLATLGLEFSVQPSAELDEASVLGECADGFEPRLERLARLKGDLVALNHPDAAVLSADTVVMIDGRCLGKPRDAGEARAMLKLLGGRKHLVVSGVCVQHRAQDFAATGIEQTAVVFNELDDGVIERYVERAEPFDKAGAYAIQGLGALLVERISGDYSNVVGLPLGLTARLLEQLGITAL